MKHLLFLALFASLPAQATSLCVDVPSAVVRAAPNSKARILWTAPKYSPFVYLRQQSGWVQVSDMDGLEGWVAIQSITQKYRCAAIKSNLTTVYQEPSPAKAIKNYLRLDKYWPLKRLDRKDNWYKVEDLAHNVFWVREDDVWLPIKEVSFDL
jgi:SH3-like domain-containing protein